MCDKYDEIIKCKKCYIVIMPDCENHKDYLLDKYDIELLQNIEIIRNQIKKLEIELQKLL